MPDCPFKVGDRVQYRREFAGNNSPFGIPVTVTEVMPYGGFKWKADAPISMGPRLGTFDRGECYNPAVYELATEGHARDSV